METVKDVIRYEATTSNNKFMVGNTLVKSAGEDGVAVGAGSLTFGIFEKVEDKPEPTEEVPEPAAPEEGWPMKWKTPFLKVAECVREPKMKYFRTPKLGSYLAVPYDYTYEVDTMNEGDGPDLVEGECPAFPEYTTATNSARGCMALDTLGTDGEFAAPDCDTAVEWTAKLATGLARIRNETVEAERAARNGFKEANAEHWAVLSAARTALGEELQGLLDVSKEEATAARTEKHEASLGEVAEGEEPPPVPEEPEVETALREGKIKLMKLKEAAVANRDMVATMKGRTDAPSRHWSVLQAVCLSIKSTPDACDSWEKLQSYVASDAFWTLFEACDVSSVRDVLMVQSAEAIKATLEGIDTKNVERTHVPISMLMEWLQQAIVVHDAAVEVRKAKKAAAEEAGGTYEDAVEDNITDKPAEAPPAEE